MRKRRLNAIMRTVGKRKGISKEDVEREIQIAIDSGFDNPDPEVRAEWAEVPFKRRAPYSAGSV